MTKEEAIKRWHAMGQSRINRQLREVLPQHVVDRTMDEGAQDVVEGLIALGLLVVDPPSP